MCVWLVEGVPHSLGWSRVCYRQCCACVVLFFQATPTKRAGSHLVTPHERLWRPVLDFQPSLKFLRESIRSFGPTVPRPHSDSCLVERAGRLNNTLLLTFPRLLPKSRKGSMCSHSLQPPPLFPKDHGGNSPSHCFPLPHCRYASYLQGAAQSRILPELRKSA